MLTEAKILQGFMWWQSKPAMKMVHTESNVSQTFPLLATKRCLPEAHAQTLARGHKKHAHLQVGCSRPLMWQRPPCAWRSAASCGRHASTSSYSARDR